MKSRKAAFVFAALALFSLAELSAVEISFSSPGFQVGKTSGGADLSGSFTFSLGSFGNFTPTSANTQDWFTNFAVVPANGSAPWNDFGYFDGTATLSNNSGVFATANQAYIWGYNTTTISTGVTEWVLFTNTAWHFPLNTLPDPVFWNVSDVGTMVIIGTLGVVDSLQPYIQTAAVNASAVPEPATYAVIFGVFAVGLVAYRRRRQTV